MMQEQDELFKGFRNPRSPDESLREADTQFGQLLLRFHMISRALKQAEAEQTHQNDLRVKRLRYDHASLKDHIETVLGRAY